MGVRVPPFAPSVAWDPERRPQLLRKTHSTDEVLEARIRAKRIPAKSTTQVVMEQ